MFKFCIFLLLPTVLLAEHEENHSKRGGIVAFKLKRNAGFESGMNLNEELQEDTIHSREKRAEKQSYIYLDNVSGKTVKIFWRDIKTRNPAAYYRTLGPGDGIKLNTYENHEWTVEDLYRRRLMINGKPSIIQKENNRMTRTILRITNPGQTVREIGERYIEMMVVIDKAAADRHKNDEEIKKYVLTYMQLATSIFQHSSLTKFGIRIRLVLAKLVILRSDLAAVKLDPRIKDRNLEKVCTYMNRIGNVGSRRYDHKMFITRNSFGMGGYAMTSDLCSQRRSCSIVFDHGFTAAFIAAHEVAHSIGADDKDYGQHSGYVMSKIVDARFDFHRWSADSQISILKSRNLDCTVNNPGRIPGFPIIHKYPGVHYSFARQCQLEFGDDHTEDRRLGLDHCEKLQCRLPPPFSFLLKTTSSAPLDGTKCGTNKWCLSGKCTKRAGGDIVGSDGPKVDGGWGSWRQWSPCSRTCNNGVQIRRRMCDSPRPSNGGKPCVGSSKQERVCETRRTCPTSVSEKDTVCFTNGEKTRSPRRWKYYDDTTVSIDCTFEKSTCAWSNDKKAGLRRWTLHKGSTSTSNTGPSYDQTLKTNEGQYIYFESSTRGDAKAILSSPLIKIRRGCLRFSFHMWGSRRMGQLKLIKTSREISTTLWRISGNRGRRWYNHTIQVVNYNPYRLSFLAKKRGGTDKSDIALDDITFTEGSCTSAAVKKVETNPCQIKCTTSDNRNPTMVLKNINVFDGTACSTSTTTGVCYNGMCKTVGCERILDGKKCANRDNQAATRRSSTRRSSSPLDCDFERNICSWKNSRSQRNQINWFRQRQTGKGYYLRIRHGGGREMKVGSLVSREVNANPACLSFAYKLNNRGGFARLRVKLNQIYGNRTKRPSTVTTLATTEMWKDMKITLRMSRRFEVVFEATLSSGHTGFVAIDSIRFQSGRC
ncbi:uncharacterized protein LOC114516514 [Dendronephthya gigantea]|uniref:uncharacterized protein LOC114516514 n=1 Tax=Dendronephthya gigantea TaxID=151771 RepID=UPI00106D6EFA|nr:uncharacterized protein LOC114516514 [Dendronephthya gigantea]